MQNDKKFHYFGYASNLDESTLEGRLTTPAQKICLAVLPQFGFRFNVKNADGSARANLIPSPNESVYGVVYEISENDKAYFLKSEPGYEFIEKEVHTASGPIKAFVFISPKNETGIFPEESYWQVIVKGGKESKLPNTYLSQIINRVGKL
jgi:hypothetical protein